MQSNISDWPDFLWSDVDWKALRSLRGRFLQFDPREAKSPEPVEPTEPGTIAEAIPAKEPDRSDYWSSVNELKSYIRMCARRRQRDPHATCWWSAM
jgi:hypothetical protein